MARLSLEEYVNGIKSGNRFILGRAITLVESKRPVDQQLALQVLDAIYPDTGNSFRLGITGIPGVGKSSFIESYGEYIINKGHKLAVLAIDPTSQRTRGSILGDKTRMDFLSRNQNAFIRPTAAGSYLGGVGNKTHEAMLLCEAAGYDFIIIETVGVGQSEIAVHAMTDFFLLLMLSGAGDELQGIKRGIIEMADALVIHKADGDNIKNARMAQLEYEHALHLFPKREENWIPQVLTASSKEKKGLEDINAMLSAYHRQMQKSGFLNKKRQTQNEKWVKQLINSGWMNYLLSNPNFQGKLETLLNHVADQTECPPVAVDKLISSILT